MNNLDDITSSTSLFSERVEKKSFKVSPKSNTKDTIVFSANFTGDIKQALENDKNSSGKTFSAIIAEVLDSIYVEDSNSFEIVVEPNREIESFKTTLNLPSNLKNAIDVNAKACNMTGYEYLNKLLEQMITHK